MAKRTRRSARARSGFQPGQSGNPAGRPKGAVNKATREAKAMCNAIVDDEAYLKKLTTRLKDGTAAPAVECMVWYYAKGKPKERVEVGADKSLARLVAEAMGTVRPDDTDEST